MYIHNRNAQTVGFLESVVGSTLLSPIIEGNEKGRILNHELVSVKKTSGVIVF